MHAHARDHLLVHACTLSSARVHAARTLHLPFTNPRPHAHVNIRQTLEALIAEHEAEVANLEAAQAHLQVQVICQLPTQQLMYAIEQALEVGSPALVCVRVRVLLQYCHRRLRLILPVA